MYTIIPNDISKLPKRISLYSDYWETLGEMFGDGFSFDTHQIVHVVIEKDFAAMTLSKVDDAGNKLEPIIVPDPTFFEFKIQVVPYKR